MFLFHLFRLLLVLLFYLLFLFLADLLLLQLLVFLLLLLLQFLVILLLFGVKLVLLLLVFLIELGVAGVRRGHALVRLQVIRMYRGSVCGWTVFGASRRRIVMALVAG